MGGLTPSKWRWSRSGWGLIRSWGREQEERREGKLVGMYNNKNDKKGDKGLGREESGIDILGNLDEDCLHREQKGHQVINSLVGRKQAIPPLRRGPYVFNIHVSLVLSGHKDLCAPNRNVHT